MSIPRVVLPDSTLTEGRPFSLSHSQFHHFAHVLRLSPSDTFIAVDKGGVPYLCELRRGGMAVALSMAKGARVVHQVTPLVLLAAVLKAQAMDTLVRKSVELGATSLVLTSCERSVPHWNTPQKVQKALRRCERIALEACAQCCRAKPPELRHAPSVQAAVQMLPSGVGARFFLDESPGVPGLVSRLAGLERGVRVVLACGPEGSFSDAERDVLVNSGFVGVGVGPRVLRADTAAVAAIAVVQAYVGDLAY